MTTKPTIQKRWPKNAEQSRCLAIETALHGITLLQDARSKLDRRDHPALTALDIADAMRCFDTIISLMKDAKVGVE